MYLMFTATVPRRCWRKAIPLVSVRVTRLPHLLQGAMHGFVVETAAPFPQPVS